MAGRYPYHMGLARVVISDGHPLGMPFNQTTIANELKKGDMPHIVLENGTLACTIYKGV